MKEKLAALGLVLGSAMTFAESPSTVSMPVDLSTYITSGVTALGGLLAAGAGAYVGFLLVRKGLRWIGRFF